jgi:alpha-amylase
LCAEKTISFILALHNHQPEGNLPEVFERTFHEAYEPFIRVLESFPQVKVVQHYSGILLRWLVENQPDFIERLRVLAGKGQIEFMGGAFYEPILVMIPDDDKMGQIEKQRQFMHEIFQVKADGCWLAERVWEPHLARSLALAGIHYTVLDDAHFHNVGFKEEDTLHYYVTEEAGERLNIFPISEKLRYLIPFADPGETIELLREMATVEGDRVMVLADDGEKFGAWPDTAKHVYEDQWLSRFFTLLQDNRQWLKMTTFNEFLHRQPPAGRVYLPAGSYREMMQWSGGFWRNFFVRYPESNQIHKKMLHVHEKVRMLPDGPQKKEATDYLWAGQCNCAYWHGVFGGLYLNFLRSALYSRLIAAEDIADRVMHPNGGRWVEAESKDFDYDGKEEILINGPDLTLVFAPARGGALIELDFKPRRFNLLDVLSRRPEPYHCNIYELAEGQCDQGEVRTIHQITRLKEPGLKDLLIYDGYRRVSLIDHFMDRNTSIQQFSRDAGSVEIGDFVSQPYAVTQLHTDGIARLVMERKGNVLVGGKPCPVTVAKSVEYVPASGEIHYFYKLINTGSVMLETNFAVEFNINLLAGTAPDRYYVWPGHELAEKQLNSHGELRDVHQFGMVDEWQGISVYFSFYRNTNLWRLPLETVSQSEAGIERVYQGSSVIPYWMVRLEPGKPWTVSFTQAVRELTKEVQTEI